LPIATSYTVRPELVSVVDVRWFLLVLRLAGTERSRMRILVPPQMAI
jgi:hypothetical protein